MVTQGYKGIVTNTLVLIGIGSGLFGCGENTPTFSALADSNSFVQSADSIGNKTDILWVIDSSGSMGGEQAELRDNFDVFINDFVTKGFDYQLAVTTCDAWRGDSFSEFKSGGVDGTSGFKIVTPETPDPIAAFKLNVVQGTTGSGTEKGKESMLKALQNPANAGFIRADSFVSIIIVTDEDDDSADNNVENYIAALDDLTGYSGSGARRYSVNVVVNTAYAETRYEDIVAATDGLEQSIAENFGTSFVDLSANILQLTTQFFLDRAPVISSIEVIVNGQVVQQATDSVYDGWVYIEETNSIIFQGEALPEAGSNIIVNFDPKNLVN